MPGHQEHSYPIDVKQRTYLSFIAYNYQTPSLNRRKNTGLNTNVGPTVVSKRGNPLFEISTYIPAGFGDKISAKWQDGSVVFVGGSVRDVAESKNLSELGSSSKELVRSVIHKFAMEKAVQLLDASGYRDTIEAVTQKTIAPNETLLFRGTNHRDLSVDLKMTPKNKQESFNIIRIVDLMRFAGTAQFTEGGEFIGKGLAAFGKGIADFADNKFGTKVLSDTTAKAGKFISNNFGNLFSLYSYPPIFDIRIVRPEAQTARSGSFVEFKSMALLDFSVAYSEESDVFEYFKDGTPVSTTLRLQFKSLYPVFKTQTFSDPRAVDAANIQFGGADG